MKELNDRGLREVRASLSEIIGRLRTDTSHNAERIQQLEQRNIDNAKVLSAISLVLSVIDKEQAEREQGL